MNNNTQAVKHYGGAWGDMYKGTMQQLIETGKFKAEWFPGMPGNKATSVRLSGVEFDGRIADLHITRHDSGSRTFYVNASIDEGMKQARQYADFYELAYQRSMERASSWLRSMVKSEQEFVAVNVFTAKHLMGMHIAGMKSAAGYSMTEESFSALESAMAHLVEAAKGCAIEFSAEAHEASRYKAAAEAFEHSEGLGKHIDRHPAANIDREAEKAKFIADALALPVAGYVSKAVELSMA